jgi:hypothetical protein
MPGRTSCPDSPTSGEAPTIATPAMRLTAPIAMKPAHEQIAAAIAFPAKMSVREDERVRIIFQVPCRSSPAKASPANRPASTGTP